MKKLLGICTAFGITMSSGLSIIACSKKKEQEVIDKVIEQLKGKTLDIAISDNKESTLKSAIENHSDFKTALGDSGIKIETFEFKKDSKTVTSDFKDDTIYDVQLKIKKENVDSSKTKEGTANFKVKLKLSVANSTSNSSAGAF